MNFVKLNIGYNSVWTFKTRYHISNEQGEELYYSSKPSIWKSDIIIHDPEGKPRMLMVGNVWQTKYEIFDITHTKALVAKVSIKISMKTRLVVESQTMGWFKVVSNSLLKGNFLVIDEEENEMAMFTRKLEGLRYEYGLAIKEDSDLLLISSLIILMEIKRKQGSS